MKIIDILKATNGNLISGDLQDTIENISIDSRQISEGDMYIPIKR